jgi:hypothetical protein
MLTPEQKKRAEKAVENTLDDMSKRVDEAVERFRKKHPSQKDAALERLRRAHDRVRSVERPKKADTEAVIHAANQYEAVLKLEAAQHTIRAALGHGAWFFENKEIVALGSQSSDEFALHQDPWGSSEGRAIVERAKKGDQFARRALHNKLIYEIRDDLLPVGEYQEYLLWLLRSTREGKRRRGRHPKLNHQRDRWICEAVRGAMSHGFRLTRNRESAGPSASSLVAEALTEFGIHMTEANVELIAKDVDPKKSEE